jgi:hypothetical protein
VLLLRAYYSVRIGGRQYVVAEGGVQHAQGVCAVAQACVKHAVGKDGVAQACILLLIGGQQVACRKDGRAENEWAHVVGVLVIGVRNRCRGRAPEARKACSRRERARP